MVKMMAERTDCSALPFAAWPLADRRLWEHATAARLPWEDLGPAAHWSDSHRQHVMWAYGRWLRFLEATDTLTDLHPAQRVTRERAVLYARIFENRLRPRTTYNYVRNLFEALRVMLPEQDWSMMTKLVSRLRQEIHPNPDKRPLLRDSRQLYELGVGLMRDAETDGIPGSLRQAVDYRDGLLIAFLAARPLRRRTLLSIRVNEHLNRDGDYWMLHLPAEATKTRRPIEIDLPRDLGPYLDRYLSCYRRRFKAADCHDALWASKNGRPMGGQALYRVITRRTQAAFGRPIHPHLFRDCAATTIAIRDPQHVRTIAQILGHSTLDTAHRHYIQAGALEASRAHGDVIEGLRRRASESNSSSNRTRS